MLFYIFLGFNLIVLIYSYEFHQYIDDDEVAKIFNVLNRTSVPDYDIVKIDHKVQKRSLNTEISFRAFNKSYFLNLELNESFLVSKNIPLYFAFSKNEKNHLTDKFLKSTYELDAVVYQDVANSAAIVATRNENGVLEFEGTIDNDTTMRPLHFYLNQLSQKSISRIKKRFTKNILNETYYIIAKNENKPNTKYCEVEDDPFLNLAISKHEKRDTTETLYPQLLVALDYAIYKKYNFDTVKLVKYIIALYNAVDLRFRTVQYPKIRLSICAVIIAKDPEALTFFKKSGYDYVLGVETLSSMEKYFWKNAYFFKTKQDISVGMTGLDLVTTSNTGYRTNTLGLANRMGICDKNNVWDRDLSVTVIEESGDFNSIVVIAHEIGHLFGASHDGVKDAAQCTGNYLMHPFTFPAHKEWSECSLRIFRNLTSSHGNCLRNKPLTRNRYPIIFPGQIIKSLDEQCNTFYNNTIAEITNEPDFPCGSLRCHWDSDLNGFSVDIGGALDGTSCQNNEGMCIQRECVPLNRLLNKIPHDSGQR